MGQGSLTDLSTCMSSPLARDTRHLLSNKLLILLPPAVMKSIRSVYREVSGRTALPVQGPRQNAGLSQDLLFSKKSSHPTRLPGPLPCSGCVPLWGLRVEAHGRTKEFSSFRKWGWGWEGSRRECESSQAQRGKSLGPQLNWSILACIQERGESSLSEKQFHIGQT